VDDLNAWVVSIHTSEPKVDHRSVGFDDRGQAHRLR
jgi:hypothetical protein